MRLSASKFELELSGTVREHRSFGERLAALGAGESVEISLEIDGDPSPYERYLQSARVTATSGLLLVTLDLDRLIIDGSTDALRQFAGCFYFPDDTEIGYHVHHEPSEWQPLIHDRSMPLIIIVR